ncbi:hypothetical protein BJX66DRAFT_320686, partial [Aspergillus keveii]
PRQSHTVNKTRSLVGILFVVDKALVATSAVPQRVLIKPGIIVPQVQWVWSATNILIEIPQQREDSAWASGCPRICSMAILGCKRTLCKLGEQDWNRDLLVK